MWLWCLITLLVEIYLICLEFYFSLGFGYVHELMQRPNISSLLWMGFDFLLHFSSLRQFLPWEEVYRQGSHLNKVWVHLVISSPFPLFQYCREHFIFPLKVLSLQSEQKLLLVTFSWPHWYVLIIEWCLFPFPRYGACILWHYFIHILYLFCNILGLQISLHWGGVQLSCPTRVAEVSHRWRI